ncbi:MAG: hypothetical protein IKP65_02030, partial [Alphaproteobacteria bacterium]|nr:hypothetical protein [Alphaproteobacteria bacterium]
MFKSLLETYLSYEAILFGLKAFGIGEDKKTKEEKEKTEENKKPESNDDDDDEISDFWNKLK